MNIFDREERKKSSSNYGETYRNYKSGNYEDYFRSPWCYRNLAGDTIQKESHLLVTECSDWHACSGRVLHPRNKKESRVEMVKLWKWIISSNYSPFYPCQIYKLYYLWSIYRQLKLSERLLHYLKWKLWLAIDCRRLRERGSFNPLNVQINSWRTKRMKVFNWKPVQALLTFN